LGPGGKKTVGASFGSTDGGQVATYPFLSFSATSFSISARALSGDSNSFLTCCPALPIRPYDTVSSAPRSAIR
jgi:hypothetical protein